MMKRFWEHFKEAVEWLIVNGYLYHIQDGISLQITVLGQPKLLFKGVMYTRIVHIDILTGKFTTHAYRSLKGGPWCFDIDCTEPIVGFHPPELKEFNADNINKIRAFAGKVPIFVDILLRNRHALAFPAMHFVYAARLNAAATLLADFAEVIQAGTILAEMTTSEVSDESVTADATNRAGQ